MLLTLNHELLHEDWQGRPDEYGERWFGYNDPEFNENFEESLKTLSKAIMYLGLLLYILKLDFNHYNLVAVAFVLNLGMLAIDFGRDYYFGIDTIAYLDQAS